MNAVPRKFPARMTALNELLVHVASICQQAGLRGDEQTKVALVIEELFSNTVRHGYQQDSDYPVWIAAHREQNSLRLVYQDEAPAFNPLTPPASQISADLGGWGIRLIAHFAAAAYLYESGRNTLTLTFPISPSAASNGTRAG